MRAANPLFPFFLSVLLVFGISPGAQAADRKTEPSTPESLQPFQFFPANTDSRREVKLLDPLMESKRRAAREWRDLLDLNTVLPGSNICYTMRSYKVKRQERFADNESGQTSYTTCQMGSEFQFRSAAGESSTQSK
jgi:hypothetical protein